LQDASAKRRAIPMVHYRVAVIITVKGLLI
jgi:hypothetical protein